MRIGEVSRIMGLPASTIRFYESNGLIEPAQRHPNGYRDYPESVLGMLGIIKMAQQLGFSLEDIRAMVPAAGPSESSRAALIKSLQGKRDEIRALQQRLAQTEGQLNQFITILENRSESESCAERRQKLVQQLTQYALATSASADVASVLAMATAR